MYSIKLRSSEFAHQFIKVSSLSLKPLSDRVTRTVILLEDAIAAVEGAPKHVYLHQHCSMHSDLPPIAAYLTLQSGLASELHVLL